MILYLFKVYNVAKNIYRKQRQDCSRFWVFLYSSLPTYLKIVKSFVILSCDQLWNQNRYLIYIVNVKKGVLYKHLFFKMLFKILTSSHFVPLRHDWPQFFFHILNFFLLYSANIKYLSNKT